MLLQGVRLTPIDAGRKADTIFDAGRQLARQLPICQEGRALRIQILGLLTTGNVGRNQALLEVLGRHTEDNLHETLLKEANDDEMRRMTGNAMVVRLSSTMFLPAWEDTLKV